MTNNDISTEEKIDYIYKKLKKQERLEMAGFILKWSIRIFIVSSLMYFFLVKLPVLKEEIIESITPEVPSFDMESITNSDTLESLKEKFGNISTSQLEKLGLKETEKDTNDNTNNYY